MQIRAQILLGIVRSWLGTTAENWQCLSSYRCGNLGQTFKARRKNASWDKLKNQWLMNFGMVCTFLFSVSRFPVAFPFPGPSLPLCFFPVLEFHFSLLYVFLAFAVLTWPMTICAFNWSESCCWRLETLESKVVWTVGRVLLACL